MYNGTFHSNYSHWWVWILSKELFILTSIMDFPFFIQYFFRIHFSNWRISSISISFIERTWLYKWSFHPGHRPWTQMIFLTKAFTKLHFIMGLVLLYARMFTSGVLTASLHELGHLSHSKVRSQKCDSEPAQSSGRDVFCGESSLWVKSGSTRSRGQILMKRGWPKEKSLTLAQFRSQLSVYSCKEER